MPDSRKDLLLVPDQRADEVAVRSVVNLRVKGTIVGGTDYLTLMSLSLEAVTIFVESGLQLTELISALWTLSSTYF